MATNYADLNKLYTIDNKVYKESVYILCKYKMVLTYI